MKKKQQKNKGETLLSQATAPVREAARAMNWKLVLIVAINTVIIFGFYRLMLNFYYFEIVMAIYLIVTAGFVFAYFIYNRGMTRRNVTRDMLPDEWTDEQKTAYISDGARRLRRSRWMLTVIFPLILTFMFDFIELYWGDMFARWFQ